MLLWMRLAAQHRPEEPPQGRTEMQGTRNFSISLHPCHTTPPTRHSIPQITPPSQRPVPTLCPLIDQGIPAGSLRSTFTASRDVAAGYAATVTRGLLLLEHSPDSFAAMRSDAGRLV
ncbi:unnamed protein product [Pleuronectes platessa]|uniref:Uncharacterized protein n=1 Tax=Pleuronectes platessa TaxID=8262 RepID=A0A9N7ZD38_PLEPL|nr:unnamed protein product [Pleuronectes platessa]